MGIINPRPAMRAGERRSTEGMLRTHAHLMRRLEEEGWDRDAASREAMRVLKLIGKKQSPGLNECTYPECKLDQTNHDFCRLECAGFTTTKREG